MAVLYISGRYIQATISLAHTKNGSRLHMAVNNKKTRTCFAGFASRDAAREIIRYAKSRPGMIIMSLSGPCGLTQRKNLTDPNFDRCAPAKIMQGL